MLFNNLLDFLLVVVSLLDKLITLSKYVYLANSKNTVINIIKK